MITLPVILVTGANGQLGKALQSIAGAYPQFRFVFLSRSDLPIHHFPLVRNCFEAYHPAYCINCAAYTAVDRAEAEKDLAMLVNGEAVGILAAVCHRYHTRFIHVSTDYVFNGESSVPYKETDPVEPVNVYGESKLDGERRALQENPETVIMRTSWVYSEFGNNFVKTMLRLMRERDSINVVNDQVGSPTYATDLANAMLQIISAPTFLPGIYHYANQGKTSWFAFALAIKEFTASQCKVIPVNTSEYPTAARRPCYSLLDTTKFTATFGIPIPAWRESLAVCMGKLISE